MIGGLSSIPSGGGKPEGKEGVQYSPRDVQPVDRIFLCFTRRIFTEFVGVKAGYILLVFAYIVWYTCQE